MYYTIYKITNIQNGKYYIGKHQTEHPFDSYIGSGRGIKAAIKLYGQKNFIKEVLFIFNDETSMNNKEKELITEELVSDVMCYNQTVGGEGGPHFKGRRHTTKTKEKIRKSVTGFKHTKEARKKISEANRNRPVTESFKQKMSRPRRPMSEETKRKISQTRLAKFNAGG